MELALIAVVLAVAAAHRLLGFALAAQGAHAFSRQAVRGLDARAAVAAGHLGAGVFQGCGEGGRKVGLLGEQIGFFCRRSTPVNQLHARTPTVKRRAPAMTGLFL